MQVGKLTYHASVRPSEPAAYAAEPVRHNIPRYAPNERIACPRPPLRLCLYYTLMHLHKL